jgi:ABC-type transporter Mla maintaining outer membrane lipid asymmetry ATPase subunit MlaF
MSLLAGISTLHDTETELVLHRDWDFTVTPNLFAAIVSPSAQKKSPILKAMVTKPLRRLQGKAKKEYKQSMQQYEIDLARYEELKRNKNPEALEQEFPEGRPNTARLSPKTSLLG